MNEAAARCLSRFALLWPKILLVKYLQPFSLSLNIMFKGRKGKVIYHQVWLPGWT